MAVILPQVLTRQPQGAIAIDWSNPLTKGLGFCQVGHQAINLVTNRKATSLVGQTPPGLGRPGTARAYAATGDSYAGCANIDIAASVSAFILADYITLASGGLMGHTSNLTTQQGWVLGQISGGNLNIVDGNDSFNSMGITTTETNTLNSGTVSIGGSLSSAAYAAYFNGKPRNSGVPSGGPQTGVGLVKVNSSRDVVNVSGEVYLALMYDRILTPSEFLVLHSNPWQIFRSAPTLYTAEPGGDVTLSLTGQQATAQQGNVRSNIDKSLTGQLITTQQGALVGTTSKGLSGQDITSGQGALVETVNPTLSGQQINIGQGAVSSGGDVTKALSGQDITTGQGSLGEVVVKGITGQAIAASQGNLTDNITIGITGQQINSQQGALSIGGDIVKALTGQSISVLQGSLTLPSTSTLFGGVAHFEKLNEQNKKRNEKRRVKSLESQDNVAYDAIKKDDVRKTLTLPKKTVVDSLIADDERLLVQAQLRDEMIRERLLRAQEQEEEQAIVMMLMALM